MSLLSDLETTRDQIAAQLKALTLDPQPSYSLPGRESISWTEFQRMLMEQLKSVNEQIVIASGPFEHRSQAY